MTFDDLFTAFILISLGICVAGVVWLLVKLFRFWKKHGTAVVLIIAALIAGAGWAVWYWWEAIETYAPYVIGGIVAVWFVTSGMAAEVVRESMEPNEEERRRKEEERRLEEESWWIAEDNEKFLQRISGNHH